MSGTRRIRGLVRAVLPLLTAALLAAGCGYRMGSLVPDRYRTIAVPVFDNTTPRHDLEWEVTRAVVEELQARSHLLVVAPNDSPDLVLDGVLVTVDEDTLSRRRFLRPRENVVFVAADITVRDTSSGENLLPKRRVTERESYSPLVNENVRTAREESVRALAERVVQALEAGL